MSFEDSLTLEERAIRADQQERRNLLLREADERARFDAYWEKRNSEVEAVAKEVFELLKDTEYRRDVIERAFELGGWCEHCGGREPEFGFCACTRDD